MYKIGREIIPEQTLRKIIEDERVDKGLRDYTRGLLEKGDTNRLNDEVLSIRIKRDLESKGLLEAPPEANPYGLSGGDITEEQLSKLLKEERLSRETRQRIERALASNDPEAFCNRGFFLWLLRERIYEELKAAGLYSPERGEEIIDTIDMFEGKFYL